MIARVDDTWLTRLVALLVTGDLKAADVRARLLSELTALAAREPTADADRFLVWLRHRGVLTRDQERAALLIRETPSTTDLDAVLHPPRPADSTPDGHHALLGELGQGSMGAVRVARDLRLRRKVAYKTLGTLISHEGSRMRRFVAEMQLTAQLDHPNIVPVYSAATTPEGGLAYTMKLVDGDTLGALLERAAALPSRDEARQRRDRLELFLLICDAVAYAHDRGVIHRDLKPENLMVGPRREVYVMDWGVARLARREGPASPVTTGAGTVDGAVIGTPAYMSPEQAQGDHAAVGPASDQYALGLILQELITLRPAVDGSGSPEALLYRAATGVRNPISHAHGARVPRSLQAIVARATAVEPHARYPDVSALAEDVRRHLAGEPTAVLPDTPTRRLVRAMGRNPEQFGVAALALALLAVAAVSASVITGLSRDVRAQQEALEVTDALALAERRGSAIEAEILRYGRLLEGVSAAATMVLTHAEPVPVVPPTLRSVAAYPGPVGFDAPAFRFGDAPGAADEIGRLARLQEGLVRAMVRSTPSGRADVDDAETARLLGEVGLPVEAIDLVLEDGTRLRFPATDQALDDARGEAWYRRAAASPKITWGEVQRDPRGAPMVIASRSVFGEREDLFLGVAAFSLRVGDVPRAVLGPGVGPGWLLDPDGRVIATTDGPGDLAELPRPAVVAALHADSGAIVTDEVGRVTIASLPALGWYYVSELP